MGENLAHVLLYAKQLCSYLIRPTHEEANLNVTSCSHLCLQLMQVLNRKTNNAITDTLGG